MSKSDAEHTSPTIEIHGRSRRANTQYHSAQAYIQAGWTQGKKQKP